MKMSEILLARRNTMVFSGKELPAEVLFDILTAALRTIDSPNNTVGFYVADDAIRLRQLADSRDDAAAKCLETAAVAVAVVADRLYDGSWIENAAAAVWLMSVEAAAYGVANNAVQIRGYSLSDGTLSDDVVRGILGIPDGETVYAVVALGYAREEGGGLGAEEADFSRVHVD